LADVTYPASYHMVFDPTPRLGFLPHAPLWGAGPTGPATARLIFNDRLDAVVTGVLIVMVGVIVLESALGWMRVLSGRVEAGVREAPFVATRFVTEEQG